MLLQMFFYSHVIAIVFIFTCYITIHMLLQLFLYSHIILQLSVIVCDENCMFIAYFVEMMYLI